MIAVFDCFQFQSQKKTIDGIYYFLLYWLDLLVEFRSRKLKPQMVILVKTTRVLCENSNNDALKSFQPKTADTEVPFRIFRCERSLRGSKVKSPPVETGIFFLVGVKNVHPAK